MNSGSFVERRESDVLAQLVLRYRWRIFCPRVIESNEVPACSLPDLAVHMR